MVKRSPLHKRIIREIVGDLGKYLTIFILLVAMIGLASGYFVSIGSMITGYKEGFAKYNIENGNFTTRYEIRRSQKKAIEENGDRIYPIFYKDIPINNSITIRIVENRTEVNLISLMEGRLPTRNGEISIDRTFANNNQFKIGDILHSKTRDYEIVGFAAFSDYSALFSSNKDSMFDAILFGVGVISEEDFNNEEGEQVYRYAWKYANEPIDENEERELADEFVKRVRENVVLDDYNPRYLNQAIKFAGDDLGADSAAVHLFLYIMLVIMAFVFALTTADTITRDAGVIGTLRASGYTKRELILHYLTAPFLVTMVACLIGNIIGYTWLKNVMSNLYYNSYSLPYYPTLWNTEAFLETTISPIAIMIVISFIVLHRQLSITPLQFLRHDLSRKKQKRALRIPHGLRFLTRYRLRVILQNIPNYIILFIGLLLANILLMFGLGMPVTINHYQETIVDDLLATKQYILTIPASIDTESHALNNLIAMMEFQNAVETKTEGVEKFSAYSVETYNAVRQEDVLVYGVKSDSAYLKRKFEYGEVYISNACANKFKVDVGGTIQLKEHYDDKIYEFKVSGIYPYNSAVAVFMDQRYMNEVFDLGQDYFSGYFSNQEITDIDEKYIGSVIDEESLTKVSRQLNVSFGGFMSAMRIATFIIFFVLMYLLTKIIIEKNSQSISMVKIMGYSNNEIQKLYIRATTIVVIVEMLLCLPIATTLNRWMFDSYLSQRMTGYLPFYMPNWIYGRMMLMGLGAYAIVSIFEIYKIYHIPKTDALKNRE
ncbi:MAG: ABC transporter permease [Solobacterium sp.]|nr:ABC transporter permease [Solobacterium sp.]